MNYEYALIVVSINDKAVHQDDYKPHVIEDNADIKIIHIRFGG